MSGPVLVTGGAGFIGSHLTQNLIESGYDVICLDNFDPYYPAAFKLRWIDTSLRSGRASLVEADIRDVSALRSLLRERRIEVVVHLAARAGVRPSFSDPETYLDINVRGTLKLLRASHEAGVRHIVFASSSSVYGTIEGTAREESTPCRPLSPYGAAKLAAEALCSAYSHQSGMSIVGLRLFTVYGPRQRPDMAINRFTRLIWNGQTVPIYGSGASLRDYTFVSDIVNGITAALQAPPSAYQVFNLGRGQPVELLKMVRLLETELGKPARLRFMPEQLGDPPLTFADISKARNVLNYRPQVSIEEGIARYVDWFKSEGYGCSNYC